MEIVPSRVGQVLIKVDHSRADIVRRVAQRPRDVRQGNEIEQPQGLRGEPCGRNSVVCELCPRRRGIPARRIEDVQLQSTQVAGTLCRRRDSQQGRSSRVPPCPLVVRKPEELVWNDPSTRRSPKLVELRHRNEPVRSANLLELRERIPRIEDIVPQVVEGHPVKLVRSRLGLDTHHSRRRPKLGVIGRRRQLRLREGLQRRIDDDQAEQGVAVVCPIEQMGRSREALPIDHFAERPLRILR